MATKMADFGAETIHVERPGGDPYRIIPPLMTRGSREHSCDAAEITKSKLSLGLDIKFKKGIEILWPLEDLRRVDGVLCTRHYRTGGYHG